MSHTHKMTHKASQPNLLSNIVLRLGVTGLQLGLVQDQINLPLAWYTAAIAYSITAQPVAIGKVND